MPASLPPARNPDPALARIPAAAPRLPQDVIGAELPLRHRRLVSMATGLEEHHVLETVREVLLSDHTLGIVMR